MFIRNGFIRDSVGRWVNLDNVIRLLVTRAGDQYHITAELQDENVFIMGPFDTLSDAEDYLDKGMGLW